MTRYTFKELLEKIEKGTQPKNIEFFEKTYIWNDKKNGYFGRHERSLLKDVANYLTERGMTSCKFFWEVD